MNVKKHRYLCWSLYWAALVGLSACSIPEPIRPNLLELEKKEQILTQALSIELESHITLVKDRATQLYLQQILSRLSQNSIHPKVDLFHVRKRSQAVDIKWVNYGLTGYHFYFSLDLLRLLHFENEFAAMLAIELARLNQKHPNAQPLESDLNQPVNLTQAFALNKQTEMEAARQAVTLLYQSGYDPRGVVSFYEKLGENPKQVMMNTDWLHDIMQGVRREIAMHSPLRNPVVKSPQFLNIYNKIQRL